MYDIKLRTQNIRSRFFRHSPTQSISHTVSKPDFQLITQDRHGNVTTIHVQDGQVDELIVGKERVTVITKLDSKGRLIALKVRPTE